MYQENELQYVGQGGSAEWLYIASCMQMLNMSDITNNS